MSRKNSIFCPYRVCPLGAHVDHQYGLVTGFAINHGISLEYIATTDGTVKVISKNFDGETAFVLDNLPEKSKNPIHGEIWRQATGNLLANAVKEGSVKIGQSDKI